MSLVQVTPPKPVVLHLTECYGGGVGAAIDKITEIYAGAEHHLLWAGDQDPSANAQISSSEELPQGIVARIMAVRALVDRLSPDLVHAHSSWAGVYARALKLPVPVVYQPHCFVFDDPRRSPLERWAYRRIESFLAGRGAATLVLSEHENQLARSLHRTQRLEFLPNIPTVPLGALSQSSSRSKTIAMSGRIAAQKDPQFFAEVARLCRQEIGSLKFLWLGGGDSPELQQELVGAGVEVTGWLNKHELVERLDESSIYFHSASYEGFPLSVLDAAARGLPIIARSLPCFSGTGIYTESTAQECAVAIIRAVQDEEFAQELTRSSMNLLEQMNPEQQIAALDRAYSPLVQSRTIRY